MKVQEPTVNSPSLTIRASLQVLSVALIVVQQSAVRGDDLLQFHNLQFASGPVEPAAEQVIAEDEAPSFDALEVIRERYPDGKIKVERQVTLDADGNYVNHGPWRQFSATEAVIAEGHYHMGERIGSWTRWLGKNDSPVFGQFPFNRFKAPFASQANFNAGEMDGEWLIVDADNRKVMQVSLVAGKRNGLVMTFLPNGKTYRQASYDQGVPVGDVLEMDEKSGELKRAATYIEGRKIVTKTTHFRRGKQKESEEMFLAATTVEKTPDNFWNVQLAEYGQQGKDLRHGPSKLWFENGQAQVEGMYQADKRSGEFAYWYANGQLAAKGAYVNDEPNGVWVWYHKNGQKAAVGNYRDGALVDQWRWWNNSGKLAEQKVFDGSEPRMTGNADPIKMARAPESGTKLK